MKGISTVALALVASLATGVAAQPHHGHRHAKREAATKVEKRGPHVVTEWVAGPTKVVYKLGDKLISDKDAKDGLDHGRYVVVDDKKKKKKNKDKPSPKHTSKEDLQFYQTKTKPTPAPEKPGKHPDKPKGNGGSHDYSPGAGVGSEFPSGKVPCTAFPSDFGALALPYLNLEGWIGIQKTPKFHPGDIAIDFIETGINGGCTLNSFCSYACPVGYQKTQWPTAQGATKQSIGGLYCNSEGMLELTRPEYKTLCEEGAGGVYIQNDLDVEVSTCRTDYPGTESMTIPAVAKPGEKLALTNPDSLKYYIWDGNPTTAQYYVNKKGVSVENACLWNSPIDPEGAGNWAPVNVGVGKSKDGNTYLSIFPNLPTTHALLDFNIEIIGDVNAPCSLVDGVYSGGPNGCTTAFNAGKQAIIRFYK